VLFPLSQNSLLLVLEYDFLARVKAVNRSIALEKFPKAQQYPELFVDCILGLFEMMSICASQ
jgi:hypothetical protein